MDVISLRPNSDSQINQYPLLAERIGHYNEHEHIIDMTTHGETSSSSSSEGQPPGPELPQLDGHPSNNRRGLTDQASSLSASRVISRDSSFTSGADGYGHHHRNPLNSGFRISIELLLTLGQIIASIVVLYLSRNENPQAPLFIWVVGYAFGCVATLPILYWRFSNRDRSFHQDSIGSDPDPWANRPSESVTYTAVSVSQVPDEDNFHMDSATGNNGIAGHLAARLNGLMEHLKMALDCFFAVWFVVGNVWIFGGHTNPSDAPKLYKLCIVFLTFSCIGYAMPFILCATICCCMPCIISLLGIRETPNRGATLECISSLPTYTFNLTKSGNNDDCDDGEGEGGVLASGTEKERAISSEDAVCCICLTKYLDNDSLRELPCSHVFHVECVDKWLKLNASCPLCKSEICESNASSIPAGDSNQQSTEAN